MSQICLTIFFFLIIQLVTSYLNHIPTRGIISHYKQTLSTQSTNLQSKNIPKTYGQQLIQQRNKPLRDLLGLGPAEIALTLVVALVLFGPETLKSLSKDVGRAAAELKEIPKTFKEGMEEGQQSTQVTNNAMYYISMPCAVYVHNVHTYANAYGKCMLYSIQSIHLFYT